MNVASRTARRERYEARTDRSLMVLAVASLPLLLAPFMFELDRDVETVVVTVDWIVWGIFAVDYFVRLWLVDARWRYVRREWLALVIVLVPFLRPLRLARSARVFRLARLATVMSRGLRQAKRLLAGHNLHYVLLVTAVVVVASAAIMSSLEADGGGAIQGFPDALWWAVTTVTTVGYGDTFPVTTGGRVVGAVLMLSGITLFGLVTANLAAFIVEQDDPSDDPDSVTLATISAQLTDLAGRLDRIEARQ